MKRIILVIILSSLSVLLLISQKPVLEFGNNHITTFSIAFTPDGKLLIAGGFARVYNLTSGRLDFRTTPGKDQETGSDYSFNVAASPDNLSFIVCKAGRIEIWDLASQTMKHQIRESRLVLTAACYSKDGSEIIYMRKNGEIVIINSSTYKETYSKKIAGINPLSISPAPDGRFVLIGTEGDEIISFDISSYAVTSTKVTIKKIMDIEISRDGSFVAAASKDGTIWLGSYPSLKQVNIIGNANGNGFTAISFHPSGKYLASGGKDKMIRIWTIPDCKKYSEWEAHSLALASIAFSPDGMRLASGSVNGVLANGGIDTKVWPFEAPVQLASATKISDQAQVSTSPVQKPVANQQGAQRRLALVIGNGNYQGSVLANPENDAREMRNALELYGFKVIEYENLSQNQMKQAMDEFGELLKQYDVGLFFYAGHGIQTKGYNYLIPVDAQLRSEEQVEYDCVQADRILALMESSGSKVNIIILDACRNNPFERSWTRSASGRGLAYMNAPSGTLIAYATAPGSTASDGSGKNGLYTSAILESIKTPGITIIQMFQNVRSIVSQSSNKQQIPWESTSLTGDFYFNQNVPANR